MLRSVKNPYPNASVGHLMTTLDTSKACTCNISMSDGLTCEYGLSTTSRKLNIDMIHTDINYLPSLDERVASAKVLLPKLVDYT